MARVVAASKRLWIALYTLILFLNFSPVFNFVSSWANHWKNNSTKIITLTVINTGITIFTEMTSRTVLASSVHKKDDFRFWRKGKSSFWLSINRQSLISIFMTLIASLIGAPVYFFGSWPSRFAFFTIFGTLNSLLGQSLTSLFAEGVILVTSARLLFDLIYNGTIKFVMFEFFRKPILRDSGLTRLLFHRGRQDLLTTFFKTSVLNILGFKG